MVSPRALILRAPGTNCEQEAAHAWQHAGALVETWHLNRVVERPESLDAFQILTIPGGFSYGDDLGAGRIFASRLGTVLSDALRRFRDRGGLVLGICNGFQVLVRAGLLPGANASAAATLAHNESGHFEARWVRLASRSGRTPFLTSNEVLDLPVAHAEGRFLMADSSSIDTLDQNGQIVLKYVDETDSPTMQYPANPNGSALSAAGVCDETGRVFGLMPHPERFVDPLHDPRWTRNGLKPEGDGLRIFTNAVQALR